MRSSGSEPKTKKHESNEGNRSVMEKLAAKAAWHKRGSNNKPAPSPNSAPPSKEVVIPAEQRPSSPEIRRREVASRNTPTAPITDTPPRIDLKSFPPGSTNSPQRSPPQHFSPQEPPRPHVSGEPKDSAIFEDGAGGQDRSLGSMLAHTNGNTWLEDEDAPPPRPQEDSNTHRPPIPLRGPSAPTSVPVPTVVSPVSPPAFAPASVPIAPPNPSHPLGPMSTSPPSPAHIPNPKPMSGSGSTSNPSSTSASDKDVLFRIDKMIIKAGYEHERLRASLDHDESVEEAVTRVLSEYGVLAKQWREAMDAFNVAETNAASVKSQLHSQRDLEIRIHAAEHNWRETSNKLIAAEHMLANATNNLSSQAETHLKEVEELNGQIAQLKYEQSLLSSNHDNRILAERQALKHEIQRLKDIHTEDIREARLDEQGRFSERVSGFETTIANLRQKLKTETGALEHQIREERKDWNAHVKDNAKKAKAELHHSLQVARNEHDRVLGFEQVKVRKLEADIELVRNSVDDAVVRARATASLEFERAQQVAEAEKAELLKQLMSVQNTLDNVRDQHKRELQEQANKMSKGFDKKMREVRNENEALKHNILHKKAFTGLKDRELTGRFGRISDGIKEFSNVEWDERRQRDWPFSEQQLASIHPSNTRILKKQIIQNSMWAILFHFIFQTPFQVLGEEGSYLDQDWHAIYAHNTSSLQWPEVSADVEKTRYETAKALLAVTEPSSRATGDSQWLKAGYDACVNRTMDSLRHALGKVAPLAAGDVKVLESLVRVCAKTWVECVSQPYRVLMIMPPNGAGDLLSMPKKDLMSFTLVIKPELKRFGNSQGENLARGEVIAGCQSAVQPYPA